MTTLLPHLRIQKLRGTHKGSALFLPFDYQSLALANAMGGRDCRATKMTTSNI